MHYRNGREAKNGDRIIQLDTNGGIQGGVILFDAVPGNDYCNGRVAPVVVQGGACLVAWPHRTWCRALDALHVDDVAAILAEKGLDKRPAGK